MTTVYEYVFIAGPPHEYLLTVRKSAPLAHLVPGMRVNFPKHASDEEDEYPPMRYYVVIEIEQHFWPGQAPDEQKLWVRVELVQ
jgi:hypothetical protein